MYFEKFHGTGNDFIIVRELDIEINYDYSILASRICNRHFGIGADGMMIVASSEVADIKMIFYNQDGSIAPMCGNGIRCFAKYVFDNKIVRNSEFTVETLAGIMNVMVIKTHSHISLIKINLGKATFNTKEFPIKTDKEIFINEVLTVNNNSYRGSTINMGTIHTVIMKDDTNRDTINTSLGKAIESHPIYPEKTNVNFYELIDESTISVETYERGVGWTLACGTGCAATAVVSHCLNQTLKVVDVHVKGGILNIELTNNGVYMTGPAEQICRGDYVVKNKEELE